MVRQRRRQRRAPRQDPDVAGARPLAARSRRLGYDGRQRPAGRRAARERRLLLANKIGGLAAGRRLGALLSAYPDAEFHAFADSPAAVAALAEAARIAERRELSVLVELGAGRAGARDRAAIEATIAAVLAADRLVLGGVATYEGAAATPDADETRRAIAALMERTIETFALVRAAAPQRPLIISAGGSAFFDIVARALTPGAQADGNASVILRSGALFFADHGIYARAFAEIDRRGGLLIDGLHHSAVEGFRPALTLWAEVLSRPETGLAIAGFGMRDASFDQGLPVPLRVFRDGIEQQASLLRWRSRASTTSTRSCPSPPKAPLLSATSSPSASRIPAPASTAGA